MSRKEHSTKTTQQILDFIIEELDLIEPESGSCFNSYYAGLVDGERGALQKVKQFITYNITESNNE
jgi:hypothetical protein